MNGKTKRIQDHKLIRQQKGYPFILPLENLLVTMKLSLDNDDEVCYTPITVAKV